MTTKQKDELVESALKYACEHKYGYIRDLENATTPQIVAELTLIGFIKRGISRDGETFKITALGKKYYDLIKTPTPHKSLIFRFFHRCLSR